MEQTKYSGTSAYKIQTPGNNPEESIQHLEHGESLQSRTLNWFISNHVPYTSTERINHESKMLP